MDRYQSALKQLAEHKLFNIRNFDDLEYINVIYQVYVNDEEVLVTPGVTSLDQWLADIPYKPDDLGSVVESDHLELSLSSDNIWQSVPHLREVDTAHHYLYMNVIGYRSDGSPAVVTFHISPIIAYLKIKAIIKEGYEFMSRDGEMIGFNHPYEDVNLII